MTDKESAGGGKGGGGEGERDDKFLDSRGSPKSFQLFPKLPLELRLKIWRYACPRPRVVMVKYHFKVLPEPIPDPEQEFWGVDENVSHIVHWIGPSVEIPLILHVCRESRLEALSIYEAGLEICPDGHQTYWNPKLDTVFLIKESSRRSSSTLRPLDEVPVRARVRIQHLAIDLNVSTISYTDGAVKEQLLPLIDFTSLRSLTLVIDPILPDESKSRVIFREPMDVPIHQFLNTRPTAIEQRFENILEAIKKENPGWEPPKVRAMVSLWGTRKTAWCIKGRAGVSACARAFLHHPLTTYCI
jgi:hypothetical protein